MATIQEDFAYLCSKYGRSTPQAIASEIQRRADIVEADFLNGCITFGEYSDWHQRIAWDISILNGHPLALFASQAKTRVLTPVEVLYLQQEGAR